MKNGMLPLRLNVRITDNVHNWDEFGVGPSYTTQCRELAWPKGCDESPCSLNAGVAICSITCKKLIGVAFPLEAA